MSCRRSRRCSVCWVPTLVHCNASAHLCIIGLGLIGGSLAGALKANGFQGRISAVVRSEEAARFALEHALVDEVHASVAPAVAAADIVIVAVPMLAMPEVLAQVRAAAPSRAIVTDVGSVKGSFIDAARGVYPSLARVVPGHPIAGRETSGVEAADATLFAGRRVLLTPLPETDTAAIAAVTDLWERTGACVECLDPEQHDRVLAATSHLPHVLAFALVDALATRQEAEEIFRYAAGGFRDFTRIASSDAIMWRDVCLTNRVAIGEAIEGLESHLGRLRDAIEAGDGDTIEATFRRARLARDSVNSDRLSQMPDTGSPTEQPPHVPVVTIDGPSGAGKGTAAKLLAETLGFHLLDSGAVYRAAALKSLREKADLNDEQAIIDVIGRMQATFQPTKTGVDVFFGDENVTPNLRSEAAAAAASRIASLPAVRQALLPQQRSLRLPPGLVADGRDMGTVVFPDADLKVFLTASAAERGKRRARQLEERGIEFTMASLLQELHSRDERDASREHSPLVAADGALMIDSSSLKAETVVARIADALHQLLGGKP